jgi:N-acetylneuraminate synthase
MKILGRTIQPGHPAYVIAEISANHRQSLDTALALVEAAHAAGADAVKLQTYTADTLTLNSDKPWFRIGGGTLWDGKTLYQLYQEAFTPWEWHSQLKARADELGLHFFSSPFDFTAVDFLESLEVAAYKIASFELVDLPLIRKAAATGRPLIMSTGMATVDEIAEAVTTARQAGARDIALLKCTSAYPAQAEDIHLRTLADMRERFGTEVGLSDHTPGSAVAVAAVALGASIIEKHIILRRSDGGPDAAFSMEPEEFAAMVRDIRTAEKSLGAAHYGASHQEQASLAFRRSLFVTRPIRKGEAFTPENVRSIRPSNGLHPRHYEEVMTKKAACDLDAGTPLALEHLA